MKRLIAIALVLSFLIAFVPTAFAASPAKSFERQPIESNVIDRGEINTELNNDRKVNTKVSNDFSNINKSKMVMKEADLEINASWQESPYFGIEPMEPVDTLLSGYYFTLADGDFSIADDFFTSQSNYGMCFSVLDPNAENNRRVFEKGESFFFNFDIIKSFNDSTGEITYLDKDVALGVYMFAGTIEEFQGDGIKMSGSWLASNSISVKVTAPEDDFFYIFYIAIMDTSLTQFGGWMSIAEYEKDNKDLVAAKTIKPGERVQTTLGGAETVEFLTPNFVPTYGVAYKVEFEEGDLFAAVLDSQDNLGGRLYLADENMDIIGETYIGAGAVANGVEYADCPLPILITHKGTYHIILAGFYLADEGHIEFSIVDFESIYTPLNRKTHTIDLSQLGTEDYIDPEERWGYFWHADYRVGELLLVYPDYYVIKGTNEDVFCDVYDGAYITLDNAKIGSIWISNSWASVTIESKGNSSIKDYGLINYTMYNYEGYNAGIYFTGDSLTIEGPLGALFDNAPIHVYCKTFKCVATGLQGSYSIAMWSTGILNTDVTLGKNPKFDGSNRECTLMHDSNGWFKAGWTVSEHEEVYHYGGGSPDWYYIAAEFTLTTDGYGPSVLIGDANQDGIVNSGDAVAILRHMTGANPLSGDALVAADFNQDGKVNTGDATSILRFMVSGN